MRMALPPIIILSVALSLAGAKYYRPSNFNKAGPSPHHYIHEKPTSRHKNHCAYVVEKTMSFTMQDGVAPYVKAEYNSCAWGHKCPSLMYRLMYKPVYKVAQKTLTELEWRCCPGYSGYGCMEGPSTYYHPIKAMPPFKGPPVKGNHWSQGHPPMKSYPMLSKGPPMKGPPPMKSYPMLSKGPPMKGPPPMKSFHTNAKGPPPRNVKSYPMRHFGPPMTQPSYPGSFEPYPSRPQHQPEPDHQQPELEHHQTELDHLQPEVEHLQPELDLQSPDHYQPEQDHQSQGQDQPELDHQQPELDHHQPELDLQGPDHYQPDLGHQNPDHHQPELDHQNPDHHQPELNHQSPDHHQPELDHYQPDQSVANQQPPGQPDHTDLEAAAEETVPPGSSQVINSQAVDTGDGESAERLDRMEEDVRRLSQGLDTLRGKVDGLEEGLRASLREDANRMLSTLLSAAPGPISAPHSTVGFANIPGGDPDSEGLDGKQAFPGLGELTGRVEELHEQLQTKVAELEELRGTVNRHDGALKGMSDGVTSLTGIPSRDLQREMGDLVDARLGEARAEILGGVESRVESAEGRCDERAVEVRRRCLREQQGTRERMEQALEGSATGLKRELGSLQAQIQESDRTDDCCDGVGGLAERVLLLEQSVVGLNQSQRQLAVDLGGHRDHVEGMIEGRLGYVEAKLNLTRGANVRAGSSESGGGHGYSSDGGSLESRLEEKLKALEGRLLAAVEELGNATAPALLEGHAVPTLEAELESLRRRLELDVDRVQKQLRSLELLCTSSSQPVLHGDVVTPNPGVGEKTAGGEEVMDVLDLQAERLNRLNVTLQSLLTRPLQRDDHAEGEEPGTMHGEILLLKLNIRSVNRTLTGLKDTMGSVVQDVGHANNTWLEREGRLAQQVKGVVQLVSRQASMLGAGERRLTRLKGELQELRRRLAGEVQGCRTTALGVQKEVVEVGGRVASVEGQCRGLSHLAEDLEQIRAELERQSDGYLSQVNSTLTYHTQQLWELRQELRNCTVKTELTQQSLYLLEPEQLRGDQ